MIIEAAALMILASFFKNNKGWVNPVQGSKTKSQGIITSSFGPRNGSPHNGTDIGIEEGTPIFAAASGIVEIASYHYMNGNYIKIKHQDNYGTYYLHLSKLNVKPGQKVKKGMLIGYSGNTGYSTGAHLHFMLLKNEVPIDAVKSGFFKITSKNGFFYFS